MLTCVALVTPVFIKESYTSHRDFLNHTLLHTD